METPFCIYIRAVGIYALLTIPALALPLMYIISIFYVFIFGWFAWAMFTILCLIIVRICTVWHNRMFLLCIAVPVSVAFSFQMIQVFNAETNVWQSGVYLLFPLAATISGWISLFMSEKRFQPPAPASDQLQFINDNIEG